MRYALATITGVSGSAKIGPAVGRMEYIRVTYTNGQAGGDLTITDDQTGLPLLTLTDNAVNFAAPVRQLVANQLGVAATASYAMAPITGYINIVGAQQASNTSVLVEVWWSET